jgi:hypothetical protein
VLGWLGKDSKEEQTIKLLVNMLEEEEEVLVLLVAMLEGMLLELVGMDWQV